MTETGILLCTALGLLLTSACALETWMAVLYPRAGTGPITALTYRAYHVLSRQVPSQADKLLLLSGPLLIVTQAVIWATLLLLGFSLIFLPQLGTGIVKSDGSSFSNSFDAAIYYAGFCLTTLGVGDLVPQTLFARLMTVTAAAVGFSFFTLVLAYVISVYSALGRRNQFASEIDYRTGRTGDTLEYLKPYLETDGRELLNQDLLSLSSKLADLLESHHFYPALHYFRFSEPRYAMSRMLQFLLETASLLRTLDQLQSAKSFVNTEPANRLWHAGLQTLADTNRHFVICRAAGDDIDLSLAREFAEHMSSLAPGTWGNTDAFMQAYAYHCSLWVNDLESLKRCTMTSLTHPLFLDPAEVREFSSSCTQEKGSEPGPARITG